MAQSLDDVVRQMAAVGIEVPPSVDLNTAFSRYIRWRPSTKDKKKSAWARLFEYVSPKSGKRYITGVFGVRGDKWDVEASQSDWSPAERAAELEARKAAEKAAEADRAKDAATAAAKAQGMWKRAQERDGHPYLQRKKVGAFGTRVGFNDRLLVPLRDLEGALHGLQYISPEGEKVFGTGTVKAGRFHQLADVQADLPICFGEGYATCASAHMATGWPAVACFDAGNLELVVAAWRKLYPEHKFVILADDDRHLLQRLSERLAKLGIQATPADLAKDLVQEWQVPDGPHVQLKVGWSKDANDVMRLEGSLNVDGQAQLVKIENAGRAAATAVAKRHKAHLALPAFADAAALGTDWNDLHVSEGLPVVRAQLLAAAEVAPPEKKRANGAPQGGKKKGPPGGDDKFEAFLQRYTLIYGTTTVWDDEAEAVIRIDGLKAASRGLVDWWLDQTDRRKMVSQDRVVFDPTGECQAPEYVNLFKGLRMQPAPDKSCAKIVAHLYSLCQEDDQLFHWVACWLALPLQRLGTKMRTALILHGRMEGTGKSLMMDIMRAIYGRYAKSITQLQLQSEYTGWMSALMFCVAEEVVSAADRKHHKGLLQNMVTNATVQISEKYMPLREERNFANFVFLSNDQIPMLLNPTDRRYTVINVERVHPPEYFHAIREEMDAGGVEAFYAWLLAYDTTGFNEFTRPFENKDRLRLITLGMTPDQRFFEYWQTGLAGVPYCPCTARDLYTAFKAWCKVNGERFVANATAFGRTVSGELERLGARAKKKMRLNCWSEKQIEEGDWQGMTTSYQGIVYFTPPAEGQAQVDVTSEEGRVDRDVCRFQEALHDLVRSARRAL